MPPRGVKSAKRQRQYEHIKQSEQERGVGTDRAEEIAARTVNKQRREAGETRSSGRSSGARKAARTSAKKTARTAAKKTTRTAAKKATRKATKKAARKSTARKATRKATAASATRKRTRTSAAKKR